MTQKPLFFLMAKTYRDGTYGRLSGHVLKMDRARKIGSNVEIVTIEMRLQEMKTTKRKKASNE